MSLKMWSGGLLLSLILLGLIVGARSNKIRPLPHPLPPDPVPPETCSVPIVSTPPPVPKCDYAMMVPFRLPSNTEVFLCSWLRCKEHVNVSVDMEYFDKKMTVVNKVNVSNYYECTNFTVPKVDKPLSAFFTYSAVGENVTVKERKSVALDVPKVACMAQKNSRLYKPGDTVKVRMVCYDENLKQVHKQFTSVSLVNPEGARVMQFENPPAEHGVVELSIPISPRSRSGIYSLQFSEIIGGVVYEYIEVEEYRLPRYDFEVQCPDTITVLDRTTLMTASAQYLYGKSVPGTVEFQCCRKTPKYGLEANCFRGVDDICQNSTHKMGENGTLAVHLDLSKFLIPFSGLDNYVMCDVTLKEEGTGVQDSRSCYLWISNNLVNLQLDRNLIGEYYNKINLPFAVYLRDGKQRPMANELIAVQIDGRIVMNVRTDANGKAECDIDTSSYNSPNITLTATFENPNMCYRSDLNYGPRYPTDKMVLYRFYSPTRSHIRIRPRSDTLPCNENYRAKVDYLFTEEAVGKDAASKSIKYIVMGKSKLATHGEITVNLTKSYSGSIEINFYLDHKLATGGTLFVMVPLKEDVLLDTVRINVGTCFKNKVNMTFSKDTVMPGGEVDRIITGDPGSLCGLRGMDIALRQLRPYEQFSAENIYNAVAVYMNGYWNGEIQYEEPDRLCVDGNTEHFYKGLYCKPTSSGTDGEVFQMFKRASMLFFSSFNTRRPKICGEENAPYSPIYFGESAGGIRNLKVAADSAPQSIDTVRRNFAPTFGFVTTIIGPDGTSKVPTKLPESLTTWESDAFCISQETGIGVTIDDAKTKTFQTLSTAALLPINIVRGEVSVFTSAVSFYNNLKCAQMSLEVKTSEYYDVAILGESGEKCACNGQATWQMKIKAKKIGHANVTIKAATRKISDTCDGPNDNTESPHTDTIIMNISCKPEGIPREDSSSHLVMLNGTHNTFSIPVSKPDNLVEDSFRSEVRVMGNPVAVSVTQLDSLLSTPSLSCDQIQGNLNAACSLAKYLKHSGRLKGKQLERIRTTMTTGYMDLMACRHYDGSFLRHPSLSVTSNWMTLFTVGTTDCLSKFIYIDDNAKDQALMSLSKIQDSKTGCFDPKESLFWYQHINTSIPQFTATAVITMWGISNKSSIAEPMLKLAEKCLNNTVFEDQDVLTQAMLAHVAALSGQLQKWKLYHSSLMEKATSNADGISWKSEYTRKWRKFLPGSHSGDVMTTGTMLLAMAAQPEKTSASFNTMGNIAKHLAGRLTAKGGCGSAQSTALVIRALANFGKLIDANDTEATVALFQNDKEVYNWTVNSGNEWVVQMYELKEPFGNLKFISKGKGTLFIQVVASFNTKITSDEDSPISVIAVTSPSDCFNGVAKLMNVKITIRPKGDGDKTGPINVSLKCLTGYSLYYNSANQETGVSEPKMLDDKIYMYIQEVTSKGITITVSMYMVNTVDLYQGSYVIAELVDTGETARAQFSHPCASQPAQLDS